MPGQQQGWRANPAPSAPKVRRCQLQPGRWVSSPCGLNFPNDAWSLLFSRRWKSLKILLPNTQVRRDLGRAQNGCLPHRDAFPSPFQTHLSDAKLFSLICLILKRPSRTRGTCPSSSNWLGCRSWLLSLPDVSWVSFLPSLLCLALTCSHWLWWPALVTWRQSPPTLRM